MVKNVSALRRPTQPAKKVEDTFRQASDLSHRFQLIIPKEWHKQLRLKAIEEDSTVADLIRTALAEKYGLE